MDRYIESNIQDIAHYNILKLDKWTVIRYSMASPDVSKLTMLVSSVACGEDNSSAVDGEECGRLQIELDDTAISKLVL